MLIKVKVTDEDGHTKGRAYTYQSDIDVAVGDLVVADMAGHDKTLLVVETGIDPSETEGADFIIKTIKGLASDIDVTEATEEPSIDIKIEKESLPVIKINFESIKTSLTETLKKYQRIVVTESTLAGCKSTQKELAGLRTKIDNYRKEKKKSLSEPIIAFENQCKELISLIEQAETPIKEGIKVFDDQKRNDKYQAAEKLIKAVAEKTGLREKYGSQLTVLDKYCNLTAKEGDVRSDLEARALALLSEQNREDELIDIIKDSIDSENQRIDTKLKFEDFKRLIDRNVPTKDILAEVKARAESIYKAEHPEPKPEPTVEPITETYLWSAAEVPKLEPQTEQEAESDEAIHYAVYRITGSEKDLLSVSKFLKDNDISYKVTDQGEVE